MQLAAACEKVGTSLVTALLLAAATTMEGLLESEALRILPTIARTLEQGVHLEDRHLGTDLSYNDRHTMTDEGTPKSAGL